MESTASRSARVKLQLRDKHGRWIKMGAHVKWFSMFRNKELFGKVTGGEGQNVLVDTKSFSDPTKDVTVKIPHEKVEVIDEKASLEDVAPKPATHLATGNNPITYNVSAKDGNNVASKVGDLKVGEKVYPVGTNEKPYGVPVKTSSYAVKKHSPHQLGTVVSNKPDKGYITVEDATGKKHFPAKHYFAVKQHPGIDKALQDAKQKEHELLNNTSSGGHKDDKTWIDALGKHDDVPARPAKAEPANNEGQIGMHVDNMPGGKNDPNIFGEGYKKLDTLPQPSGYKKGDKVVLKDGRTGEFIGTGTHQTAEGPLKVTKWKINGQTTTVFGKDIHAVFRPETNVITTHEATKPFGDEYKAVNFDIAKTPSETFKPGDKIVYGNGNHPGTVQQVHEHDIIVSKDDTATSNYTSWIHLKPEQVNALYRKDGETAAPAAETPAPEPAAPEEPKIPSIANWTKVGGAQGSNDGGTYKDENGKLFYVKLSQSDTHARNEVLADDLYKAAGIETTDLKLVDVGNGKLGTASAILEDSKPDLSSHLHDKKYLEKIQEGFAVDALLSNWDVAGLGYDNIISDKHGTPVRVDPGGALLFRAMGSPKGDLFTGKAGEWDTLRNGSNPQSKALFGSMSNAQLIDSAKKVEALTPEKMNAMVDSLGFDEAQANELKTKLASRREDILARAAALAPAKAEPAAPTAAEPVAPTAPEGLKEYTTEELTSLPEGSKFAVPGETAFIQKNNGYWKTYLGGGAGMVTPVSAVADLIKSEHMVLDSSNAHTLDNPSVTGNELYDGLSQMHKNYLAEPVTIPYGSYGGNHPFDGFPGYNQTEAEQISQYIEDSDEVNDPLRSGIAGDIQSKALEIVGMDQVIKKSALLKDVTVYRGVSANDTLVHNLINNKMYSDFGYTSTSTDKNLSESWVASTMDGTTPVMLHINLPAGYKAHQIDYNAVGQHSFTNEQEVILGRGGVFDVTHLEEYTNATGQKGYIATVSPILTEDNFDGEYHGHNTGEETTAGHPAGPQEPVSDAGGSGDVLQPGGSPEAPGAVPSPAAQEPAAKAEDKVTPAPAPAQGGEAPSAPIADVPLIDKGKTISDSAGNEVKVGAYVLHSKGKHGVGQVYQVLPSTKSVKIKYADGTQQTSGGHLVTVTDAPAQIPSAPAVDSLNAGDIHYDSATGKTYIGSKDGKPLTTGDKISYTKKGVTTEGTVKGIYPGEKTVKIEWNDGSKTGPKKASTLSKIEDAAAPAEHHDAPEQPQAEAPAAPETAPQPEPVHEPAPEPVSAPEAPSDSAPEHLGGLKVADVSLKQLNDAPAGTEIHKPNGSLFFTKGEDGIWRTPKNNTYTSQQIKSVSDDLQGKLTLHDADQAGAAPAAAPESVPDAPSADGINGKSLTNVSLEQLNAAPSGSKLSKENGTYWQKGDDGKWLFHHEDGSVQPGGTSSNGFKSLHEQDGYTFQLPSEEQAAPETPASLEHLNGKSIKDASAEDIKALPVGSRITKDSGVYWEKTADNTWEAHYSTGAKIDSVSESNDEELHALSNIASTTFKISLPADNGGSESAPQGFDHLVGTKWEDNGPSAADLPVGTTLEGDSGAKFTKQPDGSWKMQGYSSELNNDQMDLGKGHGYKFSSVGNDGAGAEAPSAPEAPSVDPKNIKSPEDFQSLPVGSTVQVKGNEGGYGSFTKLSDNKWKSNKGGTFDYTDNQLADGDTYELLPSGTPSEPSSMEDHVGKKLQDPTLPPTSELPVGSIITSPSGVTSIKKTAGDEWTSQMSGKKYTNNDLVGLGHPGEWTLTSVGDAPAADAPAAVDPGMKAYDYDALDALPIGTKITNSNGYSLIKGGFGVYSKDWAPVDENGNHINFVDGSNYAVPGEIAKGSPSFNDGMWKVVPEGTSTTAPTQTTPSGTKNLSAQELENFPEGTKITDGSGNVFTKHYNDGWKGVSPEGNPYLFPDGSYTAYNSEMSKSHHWFPNAFWTVSGDAPAADNSTPASAGKLIDETTAESYPEGTVLHGDNGVVLTKKSNSSWSAMKDGDIYTVPDGTNIAYNEEISKFFPGVKWSEDGAPASAPAGAPTAPTGPVGSATNPAKTTGVTLTSDLLDSYPVGTTLKREGSSNSATPYYYVKQADGTWNHVKKTGNVQGTYSNSQLLSAYGHFAAGHTAAVSQPKPWVKSFISNTGEHGYVGDTVKYHTSVGTETGYVTSITDAGKVNVQLPSGKGYKAPSKLSVNDSYGFKNPASTPASSSPTASSPAPAAPSGPHTDPANFAGASADEYNAEGVTVAGNLNAPKSGLGLAATGPVDKSNPLYGTPQPNPPAAPDTGKWNSADWLKKVEDRYKANPNKAKDTVQQSNNWNTVQSVLDGHAGSLDKLLSSKYIDDAMFQEAKDGIKAHEDANASTLAKHQQDIAGYQKSLADWQAANPSASQIVDVTPPALSTDAFTGGTADWSKAPVGTYSADNVIAAVKANTVNAKHGFSVATDSAQIEDLNVKFNRVLDTSGTEVLEVKFKVTGAHGATLANIMQQGGATKTSSMYLPHYAEDPGSGLLKDTATSASKSTYQASGSRYSMTTPSGATVIFNRASNADSLNPDTLSNSVRVLMPKDSTSADYQKVLEDLGINAKPATAGDLKVFAENKMLATFGKSHAHNENWTGEKRKSELAKIQQKFGVSPDDLVYSADSFGDSKFFFNDAAVEKLTNYTEVTGFKHHLASGDADTVFSMITGAQPGLLSTYQRWSNGIHKSGMSSSTDMSYGSGDYIYTKVQHGNISVSGGSIGINAKAALRRIDLYANPGDGFGKKSLSNKPAHEMMKGTPHEVVFRTGVPLNEWQYVGMGSASERDKLIKRLKDHGITNINGIPLENFVLTSGMQIPGIDPSVFNVKPSEV